MQKFEKNDSEETSNYSSLEDRKSHLKSKFKSCSGRGWYWRISCLVMSAGNPEEKTGDKEPPTRRRGSLGASGWHQMPQHGRSVALTPLTLCRDAPKKQTVHGSEKMGVIDTHANAVLHWRRRHGKTEPPLPAARCLSSVLHDHFGHLLRRWAEPHLCPPPPPPEFKSGEGV